MDGTVFSTKYDVTRSNSSLGHILDLGDRFFAMIWILFECGTKKLGHSLESSRTVLMTGCYFSYVIK